MYKKMKPSEKEDLRAVRAGWAGVTILSFVLFASEAANNAVGLSATPSDSALYYGSAILTLAAIKQLIRP